MLECQISVSSAYPFIKQEMMPRDHQSIYTSVDFAQSKAKADILLRYAGKCGSFSLSPCISLQAWRLILDVMLTLWACFWLKCCRKSFLTDSNSPLSVII